MWFGVFIYCLIWVNKKLVSGWFCMVCDVELVFEVGVFGCVDVEVYVLDCGVWCVFVEVVEVCDCDEVFCVVEYE